MELDKQVIKEFKEKKIRVIYQTSNLPQEEAERRLQSAFDILLRLIENG